MRGTRCCWVPRQHQPSCSSCALPQRFIAVSCIAALPLPAAAPKTPTRSAAQAPRPLWRASSGEWLLGVHLGRLARSRGGSWELGSTLTTHRPRLPFCLQRAWHQHVGAHGAEHLPSDPAAGAAAAVGGGPAPLSAAPLGALPANLPRRLRRCCCSVSLAFARFTHSSPLRFVAPSFAKLYVPPPSPPCRAAAARTR